MHAYIWEQARLKNIELERTANEAGGKKLIEGREKERWGTDTGGTQRDDREGWRKLIQPESKNDHGKGIRQNKEEDGNRDGKKKRDH